MSDTLKVCSELTNTPLDKVFVFILAALVMFGGYKLLMKISDG